MQNEDAPEKRPKNPTHLVAYKQELMFGGKGSRIKEFDCSESEDALSKFLRKRKPSEFRVFEIKREIKYGLVKMN